MPSETIKTRFRFLVETSEELPVTTDGDCAGEELGVLVDVQLWCWRITPRTMTAAVAMSAQVKRASSRRRDGVKELPLREGNPVLCKAASSSSARRSDCSELRGDPPASSGDRSDDN